MLMARLWLVHGDLEAASRWIRTSGLSVDDEPDYLHLTEHLTLARVLIALDQPEEALRLLPRMLQRAETQGRARDRSKILAVI